MLLVVIIVISLEGRINGFAAFVIDNTHTNIVISPYYKSTMPVRDCKVPGLQSYERSLQQGV